MSVFKDDIFSDLPEVLSQSIQERLIELESSASSGDGLWTGSSEGFISRESDVQVTGALDITGSFNVIGTASVAEVVWDGSTETLTSFSSSVDNRIDLLEVLSSSFWTGSADGIISRNSDVQITGSTFISGSFLGLGTSDVGSNLPNGWRDVISSRLLEIQSEEADADVGVSFRRNDASAIGFDIWHDGNNAFMFFDHYFDSPNSFTMFRTRTAGTPIIAMTIRGDGDVGIGTSTPGSQLHVLNQISASSIHVENQISASSLDIAGSAILSGSVKLGVLNTEVHEITGSVNISGSLNAGVSASGAGIIFAETGSFQFLEKAAGTFKIPHPNPELTEDKYLVHSFVESPTAGDNLYTYRIEAKEDNEEVHFKLPDYWQYLNKNPRVFVSPIEQFAGCYGKVNKSLTTLIINCEKAGKYEVLLIGTRKDKIARKFWSGVERMNNK